MTPETPPSAEPSPHFLLRHPAHFIALGAGSGLAPFMPGTFGAAFGWWLARFTHARVEEMTYVALLVAGFLIGVWACHIAGKALGKPDHGAIVWDEIIAMGVVVLFAQTSLTQQFAGFLLFRLFDITKPPPIRQLDARFKHGAGVMIDDLVAAGFAVLCLAILARI